MLLLSGCFCLACQGCTYRAWYEGMQERQRQECYKIPSQSETQKCLERVNSITYDDYKNRREGSVEQSR
jgi:hypothetical protein